MPSERARWIAARRDRVLGLANVVGCGWGTKRVGGRATDRSGLIVFVRKKVSKNELRRQDVIPLNVGDAPTDVVQVGDLRLLDGNARVNRLARERPASPGLSIGHVKITAGTFGAVVRDKKTGQPLILSNNHVIANQSDGEDGRAAEGDAVLQPGPHDGGRPETDTIGHLYRFVPVRPFTAPPECPIARGFEAVVNAPLRVVAPKYEVRLFRQTEVDNLVDCAVAKPTEAVIIDADIVKIGRVRGMVEAEMDMSVCKSGRSSGVTRGHVVALGATLNVGLGGTTVARFTDQIVTTPMAQPGDSGSLVLDDNNEAVGLLFAGSDEATLCNRIQNVCAALDVEF